MDRGILGALQQGKAGQVLSPHGARQETALCRTVEMAGVLPRDGIAVESGRGEGTMTSFLQKLKWWIHRRRKEDELREELQFHLDEETEQRQAEGLPNDEARWAARRDLGNATLLRETTRVLWTWTLLEQFAQDFRYAVRVMIKNRAFTALAAL